MYNYIFCDNSPPSCEVVGIFVLDSVQKNQLLEWSIKVQGLFYSAALSFTSLVKSFMPAHITIIKAGIILFVS